MVISFTDGLLSFVPNAMEGGGVMCFLTALSNSQAHPSPSYTF